MEYQTLLLKSQSCRRNTIENKKFYLDLDFYGVTRVACTGETQLYNLNGTRLHGIRVDQDSSHLIKCAEFDFILELKQWVLSLEEDEEAEGRLKIKSRLYRYKRVNNTFHIVPYHTLEKHGKLEEERRLAAESAEAERRAEEEKRDEEKGKQEQGAKEQGGRQGASCRCPVISKFSFLRNPNVTGDLNKRRAIIDKTLEGLLLALRKDTTHAQFRYEEPRTDDDGETETHGTFVLIYELKNSCGFFTTEYKGTEQVFLQFKLKLCIKAVVGRVSSFHPHGEGCTPNKSTKLAIRKYFFSTRLYSADYCT